MSEVVGTYTEDDYTFNVDRGRADILMSRIRAEKSGDIKAEVEIRWHEAPLAGLLYHGTLNLLAQRSIKALANELTDRIDEVDWYAVLTSASYQAKRRYREGEPPVSLIDVDPSERPRWLLRPILEHEGPTVVAAPGGSVKSMLALACALTVASNRTKVLGIRPMESGPVLYLDWESDQYAHRNRLEAMCRANRIDIPDNIWYRREYAPVHESVDELARHVTKLGATMVVIDSKGMSLAGDPKEADVTVRLFKAVRKLGVPTLIVDHVTNEGVKKGADRPFGSVYTQNAARNVWMAEVAEALPGEVTVVWRHTKSNNGPKGTKLAWRVEFEMEEDNDAYKEIRIKPVSPIEVARLGEGQDDSLRAQIRRLLARESGPLTVDEIASTLGAKAPTVRARLNDGRADNEFANVAKRGHEGRWTLIERMVDQELPSPF